jgi:DNA-binding transcriptional ArsR family regulator
MGRPERGSLGGHETVGGVSEGIRAGRLGGLLGDTRARALGEIAGAACTTTELARRVGVSPATASHHASVLREAGLITSRRYGSTVLHRITARGAALLGGDGLEP